jgi:hypothetical protein
LIFLIFNYNLFSAIFIQGVHSGGFESDNRKVAESFGLQKKYKTMSKKVFKITFLPSPWFLGLMASRNDFFLPFTAKFLGYFVL